jgi:septal ring factor EnvC (AmiA/AmiB activator)
MVDASFLRQKRNEDDAAPSNRQLWIFAFALAVILTGLGFVLLQPGSRSDGATALPSALAREQVSNELLETTKGLQMTQQQAVDQLQIVQDQLAAQKAETKRLSEQIAAVTAKLEALQQSFAEIPSSSGAAPLTQAKSRRQ